MRALLSSLLMLDLGCTGAGSPAAPPQATTPATGEAQEAAPVPAAASGHSDTPVTAAAVRGIDRGALEALLARAREWSASTWEKGLAGGKTLPGPT